MIFKKYFLRLCYGGKFHNLCVNCKLNRPFFLQNIEDENLSYDLVLLEITPEASREDRLSETKKDR